MRSNCFRLMIPVGLVVAAWGAYGLNSSAAQAPGQAQTYPAPVISAKAAALHKSAIVLDAHVHITTATFHQNYDAWHPQQTGNWDYARAKMGGLNVVVEQLYIEDPYMAYNYSVKQTARLIQQFLQTIEDNKDKMELALTSADAKRIVASGKMAAFMALEGGFDMEGDLDVLRLFHRLGVREIQLTNHDTSNAMADAWTGEKHWNGISDKGREVIREANRLGIIIDVSHASEAAQVQAAEYSAAPVIDSHVQLAHFAGRDRRMTDPIQKAFMAKGGYVFLEEKGGSLDRKYDDYQAAKRAANPPTPAPKPQLFRTPGEDYGKYITELDAQMHNSWRTGDYGKPARDFAVKEVENGTPLAADEKWGEVVKWSTEQFGEGRVGLGFDLMGGNDGGLKMFDATQYPRLTESMLKAGLSEKVIRGVLGENWLHLLDEAKVPPSKLPPLPPSSK